MGEFNILLSGIPNVLIVDLGLILLFGIIFGRLAERVKIPAVTGYLVAGLILGPITRIINLETLESYHLIGDVALGFIAFQVGNELWFGKLKKSGMKIIIITIVQAVATTSLVILALLPFVDLPIALVLGAIAAATAPAPIMMIIKKYRTKGELTDTILPVVGLDDAVGVIIFGVLLSIGVSLSGSSEGISYLELLKEPLIEIGISVLIGLAIGYASGIAIKNIEKNSERQENNLGVICISIFLTTGAAIAFGGSPILTPMIAGTAVTNLINKETFIFEEETIRFFIPPLMVAFFTIAGAQLQFDVLLTVGIVGLVYIVSRTVGKMSGAYVGAVMAKSGNAVRKYLGVSLLPQSGVAIGLSVSAYSAFDSVNHEYALVIKNIILASVLVFALTGPVLVKIAFWRTNEFGTTEVQSEEYKKNELAYEGGYQ
ncbi:cation:proton antiporter [Mycoplasmatota bacterium]|nr:cation:proton antiporter [Mycoplasmatota bacterium]